MLKHRLCQQEKRGEPQPAPSALTAPGASAFSVYNITRTDGPVDHRSFRDQLAFSIGCPVTRSCDLPRRILKEHAPDDARRQLAERVLEFLEAAGVEVDEAGEALRRKPRAPLHRTPPS